MTIEPDKLRALPQWMREVFEPEIAASLAAMNGAMKLPGPRQTHVSVKSTAGHGDAGPGAYRIAERAHGPRLSDEYDPYDND